MQHRANTTSHYHQTLTHDLDKLRTIENDMLNTEKNTERLQLISKLEHILRVHNLIIADAQNMNKRLLRLKEEKKNQKAKNRKRTFRAEKYRLEIANIHETKHINAQIKNELQHVYEQMESLKLKFQIVNESIYSCRSATNSINDLKTKITTCMKN